MTVSDRPNRNDSAERLTEFLFPTDWQSVFAGFLLDRIQPELRPRKEKKKRNHPGAGPLQPDLWWWWSADRHRQEIERERARVIWIVDLFLLATVRPHRSWPSSSLRTPVASTAPSSRVEKGRSSSASSFVFSIRFFYSNPPLLLLLPPFSSVWFLFRTHPWFPFDLYATRQQHQQQHHNNKWFNSEMKNGSREKKKYTTRRLNS